MALFPGQTDEGHDFDQLKPGSALVSVAEIEQKGCETDEMVKGILGPDFGPLNNSSARVPVTQMVLFEQNRGETDREGEKSVQEPDFDQFNPGSASFRVAQMALFEQKGDEAGKEVKRSQVHDLDQLNHGSASFRVAQMVLFEQNGGETDREGEKSIQEPDFDQLNRGPASFRVAQMALFEQKGDEAVKESNRSKVHDFDQLNPGSASFREAQMALFGQKSGETDEGLKNIQGHGFDQLNHGSASAVVPVAVTGVLVPSSPGHAVSESPGLSSVTQAQAPTDARSAVAMLSSSTNTNGEVRIHVPNCKFVKTEPPLLNSRQMTKLCLVIVAQVALTLTTVGTTGNSYVSPYAEILLCIAKICNLTAFICFLNAILICSHNNPGVAATILKGIGIVATTYGLLAVLCMELLDKVAIQLWVTSAIFLLCIPASIAAFWA